MRLSRPWMLANLFVVVSVTLIKADGPTIKWVRRLDDAKRIATAEKKDLLINFTGIEWCGWCQVLDHAVLSKKEFAPAASDFVLVDLDFPNDRTQLGELQDLYEKWAKDYLIYGYPTVVLADASGKPYAYTGYEKGLTPAIFLAQLKTHQQVRETRDRELTAAQDLSGGARAQKLHAAIEAVAKSLGTIEDRQDDPVLALYADEVAEIRRLDADNAQKLRAIYDVRAAAREDYRRSESIFKQLGRFSSKESWPEAIAYLDKQLMEVKDVAIQFRLEVRRYLYLEWDGQNAKALETAERLVKDPRCDLDQRDWLYRRLALCLIRLGRLDEAIACFDQQIAAAADRPDARLVFLDWKANHLLSTDRRAECVAAYRQFRAATVPYSEQWQEATGLMAMALVRNGQHSEAIALHEEELKLYRQQGSDVDVAGTLMSIAQSQHVLGMDTEARQVLNEAEKHIPAKAGKQADQKSIDALHDRITTLRKTVGLEE